MIQVGTEETQQEFDFNLENNGEINECNNGGSNELDREEVCQGEM